MDIFTDCDAFSSKLAYCHFKWNLSPDYPEGYKARLRIRKFADCVFADVEHGALKGERSPTEIGSDDRESIILTLVSKGSVHFVRGGYDLDLNEGDIFIVDGAKPSYIQSGREFHCKTMLFPRNLAARHFVGLEKMIGQKVEAGTGNGRLLHAHLDALHHTIGCIDQESRMSVINATLGLVATCFYGGCFSGNELRISQRKKVECYVKKYIMDETLPPASVARHFGFSLRHLHRLFADAGFTYSGWIRRERLALAEKALLHRAASRLTITQIAHEYGFYDSAHFSNLFKRYYGLSPREYCRAVQGGPPD